MSSDSSWRVGVGVRCITPEKPIWLYGYLCEQRFQPSRGVLNDLYSRAIAFEDQEGNRAVIIALDLCTPRRELAAEMADAVAQATGLPRESILINASHTHSGPALAQADIEGRLPLEAEDREVIVEYTDKLPQTVAETAAEAFKNLAPANLSWTKGRAEFIANRRKLDEDGNWTGMGPHEPGRVDDVVPVLRVEEPDGSLRAVVFGCACHNVTLGPRNLLICSDYAGFARELIEREHPGATAIYLAGCGADANTEPRGGSRQWVHVRRHGVSLATEIGRVLAEEQFEPVDGPFRTAFTEVDLPLQTDLSRETLSEWAEGPEWQKFNAELMLEMMDRGETLPTTYSAPLSLWRFGDDLDLVGISGEVTSGYAFRAAEVLSPEKAWVTGYSHEVFGYLPTAQIIEEGGYETRGLLPPGVGYLSPDVEETVVEAIRKLDEGLS
ncbi:MAG: neutral/alkaline non-lysosomal ceramidase N-terminal domain-containing protein [Candidatus Brocadiia bacterium]